MVKKKIVRPTLQFKNKSVLARITLIALIIIVFFIGVSVAFSQLNRVYIKKTAQAVLMEANKRCLKDGKSVSACKGLYVKARVPERGMEWSASVYSPNDETFRATAEVDFDGFKPIVKNFEYDE